MKKSIFTLLLAALSLIVISQQVPREMVIMEKGTGTWCPYCPGAAMGAEDLLDNGAQVAVISYHSGDGFTNTFGTERISYYGITGFPTAFFDGVLSHVGGSSTQSMYANYLPLYNQRIAIQSSFTIDMYGYATGNTYNITLIITKVAASSASNFRAHLALTESNIVYSWQGQSEIDFCERLMAPNELGTTIDFTNSDEVIVDLTFTKDPTWPSNNCELVAFLQDNVTKECLQGTKVSLPNLQPLSAMAAFSSNTTSPCVNSSVQFTDNSLGIITSWNWTFEGGSPATSTSENPVVTYNTLGDYNVQLIVSDGTTTDTMLNQDYVNVITNPVQAPAPTGNTVLCEDGPQEVYSVNGVPWATTYVWMVDPASAGTITGPDTFATFTMSPGYLGNFQIKVRADNDCGNGAWSQGLPVSLNHTPLQYTLSDGQGYCEGGAGIEITLDDSETGVNYELYLDNVATGNIVAGTGEPISFGNQTELGIYTCVGSTAYCENSMIGNTYIYIIYPPLQAATPTGPVNECNNNTGVAYMTSGAQNATNYNWSLVPSAAGTITGNYASAQVDWDDEFWGMAFISVQGVNECDEGTFSEDLEVMVNQAPEPVVSGDNIVNSFEYGVPYSAPDNSGSSYSWNVTGGTVASGAGTYEIMVNWGGPGTGVVTVTETNEDDCSRPSEDFIVTIENTVGLDESNSSSVRIFPNPVKDELIIQSSENIFRMTGVTIMNQFGQVIYKRTFGADGLSQLIVPVSQWSSGIYSVIIVSSEGRNVDLKFLKTK